MEKKDFEFYLKYAFIGIILFAVVAVLIIFSFHEIPASNKDVILLILGVMVAKVASKVDYDWGSSASSARNAERLNQVLNTTIPTGGQIEQKTTTVVNKEAEK